MDPGPFESVLAVLSRAEVRYLVVGGVACALNGFVRTTEEVDILVDAEPENIRRLLAALANIGEGYARELRVEDFLDEEGAVRLVEDFPIGIFTRMGGSGMRTCSRIGDCIRGTCPSRSSISRA